MVTLLVISGIISAISLYDYYSTRTWQQVTSNVRNETVFEQRNKAYGAYVLRRDYGKTILYSIAGLVGIVCIGFTALAGNKNKTEVINEPKGHEFIDVEIPIQLDKKPEKEKVVEPSAGAKTKVDVFVEPKVVDESLKKETELISDSQEIGAVKIDGDGTGIEKNGNNGTGDNIVQPPIEPEPNDDPKYPAKPAEFVGGPDALKKYLMKELQMPQIAIELGINGKCYLQFTVDIEGEISAVTLQRGISDCPECDKEALRVIRKMPRWIPARNERNKPMRSIFNIPIGFNATK